MPFVRAIPIVTLVAFATAISVWLATSNGPRDIEVRVPGADRPPATQGAQHPSPDVDLSGTFARGPGLPSQIKGEWPGFRGANHDGVSSETMPLLTALSEKAPARLWEMPLGEGYAGPAVHAGRLYLLDYDAQARADVLRCLSPADGQEIWRRSNSSDVKRNHGMSRTVPAVSDKYVLTLGPKCQVVCVDADTGDYRWGIDLVRKYGTKIPPWYAGQCPLIDNGRAIIAPGGAALMIAIDCATGKVLWETPNPRGWAMSHTSIIPMEFGGFRMFIYVGSGGVAGVDAETGKLIWDSTAWRVKIAAVPSPTPLPDGRLFLSGGYEAGAMMMRLMPSGDGLRAEVQWATKPEVFGAEQQTPIFYHGYIYGAIPGGQMACLDPATGKQKWNSGTQRFGIGPYLIANDVIFVTSDTGKLSALSADPEAFKLLGSVQVLEHGHEAWGPMALAAGRLWVRDLTHLVCLNLAGQ